MRSSDMIPSRLLALSFIKTTPYSSSTLPVGRKPSIILNGADGRKSGFCVSDIIYIEVFRTELEVHCVGGKTTCIGSLREVCEKLPGSRFYRSHRSFIVNLGRVRHIEKYQFTMDNGDVVTVAKNRYAEAKKAWRDYLQR